MIVTLILIGRLFEARAKGSTSEAIRRLMSLQAKTARVLRDGSEADVGYRDGDRRRHRHHAAGRAHPRRWRGRRRIVLCRRGDDHRRADPGPQAGWLRRHRRRRSTARAPSASRARKVGADTLLAQIVRDGRGGAGLEAADPGARRQGDDVVRACRDRAGSAHLRGLAGLRPEPGSVLRARQRRRGADHRLPLRDGAGDADLDHGRHRQGRRTRHPVPPGRGAAEPARCDGRRARQDRHADQGPAGTDRHRGARTGSRRTRCCASSPPSRPARSIPSPRRSSPPRGSAVWRWPSRRTSPASPASASRRVSMAVASRSAPTG